MSGQLPIAFPPRTHGDDPVSSHLAEAKVRKTWSAKHRDLLALVESVPGLTGSEMTDTMGTDIPDAKWPTDWYDRRIEVRRRLSDLRVCELPMLRRQNTRGEKESRWFVI